MKYIEKLLNGAEVKWMPLGEVLRRTKGTKITAGQMKAINKNDAPVKIFAGGKTIAFVDFEDIPEKDINREPSVIVKSRGIIGFEYYDKPFSHKNEMWSYYSENKNISIKYVYYFLKQQEPYFQKVASKMQMPQIAIPDTEKFIIPIPPLAVQEEIVRILDKFTTLEAELEAELDCRKRQYEYYRNQLLSFDMLKRGGQKLNNVTWLSLGEVVNIKGRIGFRGYTQNDFVEEGCGAIALSPGNMNNGRFDYEKCSYISWDKYEESPEIKIFKDDIVFVKTGSTAGKLAYVHFVPEKATLNPQLVVFKDIKCNKRYLFHYLNTNSCQLKIKALAKGTIPNISQTALAKIQVPLPLPEEQQHIAEILDKFDILVTSISEGLPKEIALRRKQYEYYRNQLLAFA